jgi:hypothetical protein
MRTLLAAALFVGTIASLTTTANAAGGCGAGFHRGPYGGCVVNRGAVVVAPAPVVVAPAPVVVGAPVVVAPHARVCPYGFIWRYGHCRPI